MPGRKIPLVINHYYHVFNKGVNGQRIFIDQKHYWRMIDSLWLYRYFKPPYRLSYLFRLARKDKVKIEDSLKNEDKLVDVLAYCLMPNHFHLLLKQLVENGISIFMGRLQNSYARYYNTEQSRQGPLFQSRFKAVSIESEEQFVHVSRYIHLNPFSSEIVKNLDELKRYSWSSLGEYLSQISKVCDVNVLTDHFETPEKHWRFIADQADYQRRLEQIKHLALD